jgi:hypothetical protein
MTIYLSGGASSISVILYSSYSALTFSIFSPSSFSCQEPIVSFAVIDFDLPSKRHHGGHEMQNDRSRLSS